MKTCSKCLRLLAYSLFNKRARSLDGRQAWCRECNLAYQAALNARKRDARPSAPDALDRLTDRTVFDETVTGCWLWQGGLSHGYGRMSSGGRGRLVHRLGYELLRGPIPDGLSLDHLCRNPACWNPDHLEPVTHAENVRRGTGWSGRNARKTRCPQGHSYDTANTYVRPDGKGRDCLTCRRRRTAACNTAKVAAKVAA